MDTITNPLSKATRLALAGVVEINLQNNNESYSPLSVNTFGSYGRELLDAARMRADQPFMALQSLTHDEIPIAQIISGLEAAINNHPEIKNDPAFKNLITDAFFVTDSYTQLQRLEKVAQSAGIDDVRLHGSLTDQANAAITKIRMDFIKKFHGDITRSSETNGGNRASYLNQVITDLMDGLVGSVLANDGKSEAREARLKERFKRQLSLMKEANGLDINDADAEQEFAEIKEKFNIVQNIIQTNNTNIPETIGGTMSSITTTHEETMSSEIELTDAQKIGIAGYLVKRTLDAASINPKTGKAYTTVNDQEQLDNLVSSLEILGYQASGVGLRQPVPCLDARDTEYYYEAGDFRAKGETINDPGIDHGKAKDRYSPDDHSGKITKRLSQLQNFPLKIEMDAKIVLAELEITTESERSGGAGSTDKVRKWSTTR